MEKKKLDCLCCYLEIFAGWKISIRKEQEKEMESLLIRKYCSNLDETHKTDISSFAYRMGKLYDSYSFFS
jgi:hypothetical protein